MPTYVDILRLLVNSQRSDQLDHETRINLVPRALSLALEVGREKALASVGHMTTKHPEFVGVLN